jgi:hypothetical protein
MNCGQLINVNAAVYVFVNSLCSFTVLLGRRRDELVTVATNEVIAVRAQ